MSLIETTTQKPKEYSEKTIRKQDHGDAAMERSFVPRRTDRNDPYDLRGAKKADEALLREAFNEAQAYLGMTPEQLELEADALLAEAPEDDAVGTFTIPEEAFPTEAELGLRDRHETRKEMARLVTRQVEVIEDDYGDDGFSVPVRIHNHR